MAQNGNIWKIIIKGWIKQKQKELEGQQKAMLTEAMLIDEQGALIDVDELSEQKSRELEQIRYKINALIWLDKQVDCFFLGPES